VLDGLRAGRVAVTAGPTDPALLRMDGELVAVGADGLLIHDADGRRTPIRGDRIALPATAGPARIEDHDGAVIALSGPGHSLAQTSTSDRSPDHSVWKTPSRSTRL
jgi:hypothetical protein